MNLFPMMPIILLAGLSAFAQQPSSPPPRAKDTRQPWLVSDADRLRERFDPTAIQERLNARRPVVRYFKEGLSPINGATHAHLFFRWELFDRLLRESRSREGRAAYERDITSAGWNTDEFWAFLHTAGANHEAADLAYAQLTNGQRKGLDASRLSRALCVSRAEALAQARQHFGEEPFDKFLYEAVGKYLVMWSDGERSAAVLMSVAGGCR